MIATKLEDVARAIAAVDPTTTAGLLWADVSPKYMAMAKAAMQAIQNPGPDMVEAAYESVSLDDKWLIDDSDRWSTSFSAAIRQLLHTG